MSVKVLKWVLLHEGVTVTPLRMVVHRVSLILFALTKKAAKFPWSLL